MKPISFCITISATGLAYQCAKVLLGFKFEGDSYISCVLWTYFSMYAVANGWVKP